MKIVVGCIEGKLMVVVERSDSIKEREKLFVAHTRARKLRMT